MCVSVDAIVDASNSTTNLLGGSCTHHISKMCISVYVRVYVCVCVCVCGSVYVVGEKEGVGQHQPAWR